jgi:hypothetical protein
MVDILEAIGDETEVDGFDLEYSVSLSLLMDALTHSVFSKG